MVTTEHPELVKRSSSKHQDPSGLEGQDSKLFVHEHDDHFHIHEHYHGGAGNIFVTTIGLVIHSFADGTALGATFFRNQSWILIPCSKRQK